MYNNHEELKLFSTTGKRIMDRIRTTTFGKRILVVDD